MILEEKAMDVLKLQRTCLYNGAVVSLDSYSDVLSLLAMIELDKLDEMDSKGISIAGANPWLVKIETF